VEFEGPLEISPCIQRNSIPFIRPHQRTLDAFFEWVRSASRDKRILAIDIWHIRRSQKINIFYPWRETLPQLLPYTAAVHFQTRLPEELKFLRVSRSTFEKYLVEPRQNHWGKMEPWQILEAIKKHGEPDKMDFIIEIPPLFRHISFSKFERSIGRILALVNEV